MASLIDHRRDQIVPILHELERAAGYDESSKDFVRILESITITK